MCRGRRRALSGCAFHLPCLRLPCPRLLSRRGCSHDPNCGPNNSPHPFRTAPVGSRCSNLEPGCCSSAAVGHVQQPHPADCRVRVWPILTSTLQRARRSKGGPAPTWREMHTARRRSPSCPHCHDHDPRHIPPVRALSRDTRRDHHLSRHLSRRPDLPNAM